MREEGPNPPTGSNDRYFKALWILFCLMLLIFGWGRTVFYSGNRIVFSCGDMARSTFIPLFVLYALYRAFRRDLAPVTFWRDPLFLFVALAALSPLWGSLHDSSRVMDYLIPQYCAYLMACYFLARSEGRLASPLIAVLISSVALMVLRAFFELIFIPGEVAIMHSSSEHHTILAMLVIMVLPLAAAQLTRQEATRGRALYGLALALFLAGIFFTSSRIGWIAFACQLLCWIALMKKGPARLASVIVPLALFLMLLFLFPQVGKRFDTLGNLAGDRETGTRLMNWKMGLSLVADHPLLGIGYSNKEYYREARAKDSHFQYEHPHNLYLQVLAYLGIAGLAVFGAIAIRTVRAFLSSKGKIPLWGAFLTSFLGFLVMNCADSALNSQRATLILLLILSCLYYQADHAGKAPMEALPGAGS
ncbi:MAG: O-antigen ligase family protein [Candidatus Eremiobacteraeota bacterium]|nr:O-antigen ligase family protein [Candidatus Eremiobacteraeota bacterium]